MALTSVFTFDQGGQEAQVVLEWEGSASEQALATSCADTFWPAMQGRTSMQATLDRVQVGNSATGVTVIVNEDGGGFGSALPSSNALLVGKAVTGGFNGRFFWPGLQESDVDEAGRLTAAAVTAWQTAVDTALNVMAVAGHDMSVSDKFGTSNLVGSLFVLPYIGTQRRRLFN